jgi:transcriptional regulator with XRE-family HTH domain
VNVLVPAQLHALRLRQGWTQKQFAQEAGMKQSRVSAMEQPGAVNFNMETLIRSAAAHGVGLVVKFVPFSEMLAWENNFSQDAFDPVRISEDVAFISPSDTWPTQHATNYGLIAPSWGQLVTTTSGGFPLNCFTAHAPDYEQNPPIADIPERTPHHA